MGFLSRIFGQPHIKEYSLDEAMKIIEKDLVRLETENLEQAYKNAIKVRWGIDQLLSLIDEFSKKPAQELAKSSENVKERFCSLSRRQLSSLGVPDKSQPHEFLGAARAALDNLGGLTQRQILHIKFFFKEDFKPVARKINEINSILLEKSGMSDYQKAVELQRKIGQLIEQKQLTESSITDNENRLNKVKDQVMPELLRHPDMHELNVLESRVSAKRQEIDSFFSVQKMLKKYLYISGEKAPIVKSYIESPSNALLADEALFILEHLSRVFAMVKEGKIESEKKLEIIINATPYLRKSREELKNLIAELGHAKKKYFEELESFERSIKERTNVLSDREAQEKDLEKSIKSEKEELDTIKRKIDANRAALLLLASRILDANVIA